jgi:crossover junction endodeoxyribonuclease RuvC
MRIGGAMRILGLDPGLRQTGWGILDWDEFNGDLRYIACGVICPPLSEGLANRLADLHRKLVSVLQIYRPRVASVEETFVNQNPASTLKLGMARGVILAVPALENIELFEYSANRIKKCVVGVGHAQKEQVQSMIRILLPSVPVSLNANAADALATAICHAHFSKIQLISKKAISAC